MILYEIEKESDVYLDPYKLILVFIVILIGHFVLNLISFYNYRSVFLKDLEFKGWLRVDETNRIANIITRILCLLISFKFSKILFCRFFGFSYLKARLSSIEKLKSSNILIFVSFIITTIPILVILSLISYYNRHSTQLYISCLDSIIITIFTFIFCICEAQKP